MKSKNKNGSSLEIEGLVVKSPSGGQDFEVKATKVILKGDSPEDYPIQPKRHTVSF